VELLERDDHLAELDGWLAEVRGSGRGQMVVLGGEAGVGKTAIVRAFGERQRSVAVLAGGCEALFTPRPLGPLVDIAAEVGGELAEVTERGASAGDVLGALGRTIRGLSVAVLEDLHWADEAKLDVVHLLGRRVERMPALVIATYRDDELERDHPLRIVLGDLGAAQRVTVEPLSPGAVARLAAEHGVDGAALHARTGGNPFYVTEVLAREGAGTPRSVRDAVLARAARAELSGSPWLIGELAIWRHRAGLPHAGSERLPPPHRAELAGDVAAATEFWRARGCRYDAALVLAGSHAEDDLRESLRELQHLGARAAAAIVARRLRERGARGVQLGPRAATRANPAGLTARQLDVLALLIRGDRSAEIAAKLFVSDKTVDHHVSAILRKLGVRTRAEAAAQATRLGIAGR
jgi:DNA-binding CsgD family transcriptional regulator